MTKLHKRDTSISYDEFQRYAHPFQLIPTISTTHPVNNETPNLHSEGATLSIFIDEGRSTTTKLTVIALPSSTKPSTFYECSKGIPWQLQDSLHSPLTRLGVIISYSPRMGRKTTLPSTSIIPWEIILESTPKKLIYSTSRSTTTSQVGIPSSNSPTKRTQKFAVRDPTFM